MSRDILRRVPRDLRATVADAVARGWVLDPAGRNGHFKLRHPSGRFTSIENTPSDHRARQNLVRDIRRIERSPAL